MQPGIAPPARRGGSVMLRLPDAVVCDTGANCDFLRPTYDLPSARLWSVPVGCEQEFFHPPVHPPPAAKDPQAPLELLFYGQYIPLHGIDHILDAAAELREDPGVQFTLVGRGQEYPRIKARAQRLGLGNVSLIEWLPYEELRERIYRADVGLGIFGTSDKARQNTVMGAVGTTDRSAPIKHQHISNISIGLFVLGVGLIFIFQFRKKQP